MQKKIKKALLRKIHLLIYYISNNQDYLFKTYKNN